MARLLLPVLLVAAVGGGLYFYKQYEVGGLDGLTVMPRTASPREGDGRKPAKSPKQPHRGSIRIATFNVAPLDESKLNTRHVAGQLVQVIRRFDVLALQNVQARNQGLLVRLVEQVNSGGRHYDFAVARSVGLEPVEQYSGFLFDRDTVEIDRGTVYAVEDPARRFRRLPLAASFRARGPDPAEAFTFTLINVHTDPHQAIAEWDLLDDVFRAVRDDGRGEDDVILLGDLAGDDRQLGQLGQLPNLAWSVSGTPTTLRGSRTVDNILFDRRATLEFTGRSGVLDLMRELNLSVREVLEISDHFPVWAEFSVYEGGQAGHIAGNPR